MDQERKNEELKKIYHILENTPDIRIDRVNSLRQLIASGQYQIQEEILAEKMIEEAFQELKK